ncbi:hypothetical protein AB0E69_13300 [Kribbella sp. NPDC026611]|uniref:hypothetical protein n=1 Tax=Kribbella sp. NPDC026611 TaxID=3154911 RepID=UPI0033DCA955
MGWTGDVCRTIGKAIEEEKRTPRLIAIICAITACLALLVIVWAIARSIAGPNPYPTQTKTLTHHTASGSSAWLRPEERLAVAEGTVAGSSQIPQHLI